MTIPPNFNVPAIGQVVEVRYLYAFRQSNCLYQPVFLGPREDVEQHECVMSQLKYKAQEEEGAAEFLTLDANQRKLAAAEKLRLKP